LRTKELYYNSNLCLDDKIIFLLNQENTETLTVREIALLLEVNPTKVWKKLKTLQKFGIVKTHNEIKAITWKYVPEEKSC
jgi:DNA-binding transcriptional regulator YhcF (GntR family)